MPSKPWDARVRDLRWELKELLKEQSAPPGKDKGSGRGNTAANAKGSGNVKGLSNSARCVCCGSSGHLKRDCAQKEKTCHKCGKVGHLASVCQSKGPVPDTAPKERVPGAQPSYAVVVAASPNWVCPRCNTFVSTHLTACQSVGCKGKRKVDAPTPPSAAAEKSIHSATFLRSRPQALEGQPADAADDTGALGERIRKARNQIASCRENGFDAAAVEDLLRELLLSQAKPRTEYSAALYAKAGSDEKCRLLKAVQVEDEGNRAAAAKACAYAADLREKQASAREAELAQHEVKLACIRDQYAALLAAAEEKELTRVAKALEKGIALQKALDDCDEPLSQQEPVVAPAAQTPTTPKPTAEAALHVAMVAAKCNPAFSSLDEKQLEAVAMAMMWFSGLILAEIPPSEDVEMASRRRDLDKNDAESSNREPPDKKSKVED
jgi:hypothetical protein